MGRAKTTTVPAEGKIVRHSEHTLQKVSAEASDSRSRAEAPFRAAEGMRKGD